MILKTTNFTTSRDLCKFVNTNGITKTNIAAIFIKDDALYLLYWDEIK
jgi:hypothetical protein